MEIARRQFIGGSLCALAGGALAQETGADQ